MKFKILKTSREYFFSLGVDEDTGKYLLSIPVSNGLVDYDERYEISKEQYDFYENNMKELLKIVNLCYDQKYDDKLVYQPSINRRAPPL